MKARQKWFNEKPVEQNIIKPANLKTISECDEAKDIVMEDIAKLESEIIEAKGKAAAYNEYSDPKWYAQANLDLRTFKCEVQQIQLRRGELNRIEKHNRQQSLEGNFIKIAKEELANEIFISILDKAEKIAT